MKDLTNRKISDKDYITSEYGGGVFTDSNVITLLKKIYPINCIYITVSDENPATTFGFGTWKRWGQGRVPVGYDASDTDFNIVGDNGIGGSKSNVLTRNQIPGQIFGLYNNDQTRTGNYVDLTEGINSQLPKRYIVTQNSVLFSTASNPVFNPDGVSTLQPYITCYMWRRTA